MFQCKILFWLKSVEDFCTLNIVKLTRQWNYNSIFIINIIINIIIIIINIIIIIINIIINYS